MKISLLKKLCAIIIASALYTVAAHAQIVYTDINPDVAVFCSPNCSVRRNIDINNDGIADFTITTTNKSYCTCTPCICMNLQKRYNVSVARLNNNTIQSSGHPLDSNVIIGSDTVHSVSAKVLRSYSFDHGLITWSGEWEKSADGYLGLKLIADGKTYYGWARLSVNVSSVGASCIIKDYAYNSIPNQPILAGETGCTTPTAMLRTSGPLNFCAGDSVTLTAKGTGYLYQWKKDGINVSGATSKKYVAKTPGVYKCKVTNSCGSKASKGDTVIISCKNASNSNEKIVSKATQLTIAPNPFSNSTTISFLLPQSQKVSIQIFDGTGRLIKILADENMQTGTHQLVWNSRDANGNAVQAGVYLLKMQAGSYIETKKLVIVK